MTEFKARTAVPPPAVRSAARRAQRLISEGRAGQGFTSVGRFRARQLAEGRPVPERDVRKMRAYFARHYVDRKPDWGKRGSETPGYVAWLAWGGDAGRSWANAQMARWEREGKSLEVKAKKKKIVRRVRTPEGVARYKQPIGSIIVAKGSLRNLTDVTGDDAEWSRMSQDWHSTGIAMPVPPRDSSLLMEDRNGGRWLFTSQGGDEDGGEVYAVVEVDGWKPMGVGPLEDLLEGMDDRLDDRPDAPEGALPEGFSYADPDSKDWERVEAWFSANYGERLDHGAGDRVILDGNGDRWLVYDDGTDSWHWMNPKTEEGAEELFDTRAEAIADLGRRVAQEPSVPKPTMDESGFEDDDGSSFADAVMIAGLVDVSDGDEWAEALEAYEGSPLAPDKARGDRVLVNPATDEMYVIRREEDGSWTAEQPYVGVVGSAQSRDDAVGLIDNHIALGDPETDFGGLSMSELQALNPDYGDVPDDLDLPPGGAAPTQDHRQRIPRARLERTQNEFVNRARDIEYRIHDRVTAGDPPLRYERNVMEARANTYRAIGNDVGRVAEAFERWKLGETDALDDSGRVALRSMFFKVNAIDDDEDRVSAMDQIIGTFPIQMWASVYDDDGKPTPLRSIANEMEFLDRLNEYTADPNNYQRFQIDIAEQAKRSPELAGDARGRAYAELLLGQAMLGEPHMRPGLNRRPESTQTMRDDALLELADNYGFRSRFLQVATKGDLEVVLAQLIDAENESWPSDLADNAARARQDIRDKLSGEDRSIKIDLGDIRGDWRNGNSMRVGGDQTVKNPLPSSHPVFLSEGRPADPMHWYVSRVPSSVAGKRSSQRTVADAMPEYDGDQTRRIMRAVLEDQYEARQTLSVIEQLDDGDFFIGSQDAHSGVPRRVLGDPDNERLSPDEQLMVWGSARADRWMHERLVSQLVDEWARTSGESSAAVFVQQAAREEFNIEDSFNGFSDLYKRSYQDDVPPESKRFLRRYVRAQYDLAQARFRDEGVESVLLYRGYSVPWEDDPIPDDEFHVRGNVRLRPLSSWSVESLQARNFAAGYDDDAQQLVMLVDVPVEFIAAIPGTGSGCEGEREMIVLGGNVDNAVVITLPEWIKQGARIDESLQRQLRGEEKAMPAFRSGRELPSPDAYAADWPKATWDLPTDPDEYTVEQLRELSRTPAWRSAPAQLVSKLESGTKDVHGGAHPLQRSMGTVQQGLVVPRKRRKGPGRRFRVELVPNDPLVVEIAQKAAQGVEQKIKFRMPGKKKRIQRVRTAAGVRKYGQPIGTIIVADSPLRGLKEIGPRFKGWDSYSGVDGRTYHVGHDDRHGIWSAVDDEQRPIVDGADELEVLQRLDEHAVQARARSSASGRPEGPQFNADDNTALGDAEFDEAARLRTLAAGRGANMAPKRKQEIDRALDDWSDFSQSRARSAPSNARASLRDARDLLYGFPEEEAVAGAAPDPWSKLGKAIRDRLDAGDMDGADERARVVRRNLFPLDDRERERLDELDALPKGAPHRTAIRNRVRKARAAERERRFADARNHLDAADDMRRDSVPADEGLDRSPSITMDVRPDGEVLVDGKPVGGIQAVLSPQEDVDRIIHDGRPYYVGPNLPEGGWDITDEDGNLIRTVPTRAEALKGVANIREKPRKGWTRQPPRGARYLEHDDLAPGDRVFIGPSASEGQVPDVPTERVEATVVSATPSKVRVRLDRSRRITATGRSESFPLSRVAVPEDGQPQGFYREQRPDGLPQQGPFATVSMRSRSSREFADPVQTWLIDERDDGSGLTTVRAQWTDRDGNTIDGPSVLLEERNGAWTAYTADDDMTEIASAFSPSDLDRDMERWADANRPRAVDDARKQVAEARRNAKRTSNVGRSVNQAGEPTTRRRPERHDSGSFVKNPKAGDRIEAVTGDDEVVRTFPNGAVLVRSPDGSLHEVRRRPDGLWRRSEGNAVPRSAGAPRQTAPQRPLEVDIQPQPVQVGGFGYVIGEDEDGSVDLTGLPIRIDRIDETDDGPMAVISILERDENGNWQIAEPGIAYDREGREELIRVPLRSVAGSGQVGDEGATIERTGLPKPPKGKRGGGSSVKSVERRLAATDLRDPDTFRISDHVKDINGEFDGRDGPVHLSDMRNGVFSGGTCGVVSDDIVRELEDRGFQAEVQEFDPPIHMAALVDTHYAPVVDIDGEQWVVDYTFSQFDESEPWPLVEPLDVYRKRFEDVPLDEEVKHLPGRHNQLDHNPWKFRLAAVRPSRRTKPSDVGWHHPQSGGDDLGYTHQHASVPEIKRMRAIAAAKAEAIDRPDLRQVADNKRIMDDPNGDLRGNNDDRSRLRWNLFVQGGGHTSVARKPQINGYVPCTYCGLKLSWHDRGKFPQMEIDKIVLSKQGGRYRVPNTVPACGGCNRLRGDTDFFKGEGLGAVKPDWWDEHVRAAEAVPPAKKPVPNLPTPPRTPRNPIKRPSKNELPPQPKHRTANAIKKRRQQLEAEG